MKSSHLIKTSENKDISKKPYLEVSTNYHKYNLSLMTGKSIQVPMTTRPRHSFSSFLSPNASTSLLKAKHNHAVSIIFPLGSESPGGIKTNTVNRNQSQALWNSQTLPIPPSQALQLFNHYLTPYEKEEILSFPNIYYIPIGTSKIKNKKNLDLGFDENNGDYKITLGDHLCYRYEILNLLGSGSFGRVVKALDHKEKTEVALKIIKNKPKFHEQASEEIEILNYLKVKDPDNSFNIVHLQDHFMFRSHIVILI
jgi:Protein kinase domain